ncbi:MAG: ABC transporter substrate-binding protein [Thermoplasmatales archaeon]|mgnify:CR=1 FL=1|nr:ABC transporter substrate-binding protein [Thermoplasmatales archaeon]
MGKNAILALLVCAMMVATGAAVYLAQDPSESDGPDYPKVTVTQADGTEKTVKYKPERIVCLSTYACELLILYGYHDKVVGVTNSSYTNVDQAPYYGSGKSKDVGNFNEPNISEIVNLEPDLVITWSTQPGVAEQLEGVELPYVFLQCSAIDTMEMEATSLGKIVGKTEKAEEYCTFLNNVLDDIDARVATKTVKKTVYMESFSSYSAAGKSSAYYRLCVRAGAEMVFDNEKSQTVSKDAIILKNPSIIIKTPMLYKMINNGSKTIYDEIIGREGFGIIDAVKNEQVYILCSQLFGGPRCFAGMVACYDAMYPDEVPKGMNTLLQEYNTTFGVNMSIDSLSYP